MRILSHIGDESVPRIEAVLAESARCVEVAHSCCSPALDKAHKISEGIRRTHTALIANLSSLR